MTWMLAVEDARDEYESVVIKKILKNIFMISTVDSVLPNKTMLLAPQIFCMSVQLQIRHCVCNRFENRFNEHPFENPNACTCVF